MNFRPRHYQCRALPLSYTSIMTQLTCKLCPASLTPIQISNGNTYCSSSCAASITNLVPKRKATFNTCPNCFESVSKRSGNKHCSSKCAEEARLKHNIQRFHDGLICDRKTLKRYLVLLNGHTCSLCNNVQWQGQPIPLEVDHVNGDPSNDHSYNLRLLCPNCHSLTPTAKGKNRGRGRTALGIRRS